MSNSEDKKKHIEIHETAFVTSMFRSSNEALSEDYFAKLWNNPKTEKWIEDYLEKVSSEEAATHCLRNRYFLDTLKTLIDTNHVEVLINFGCGFSMYPFLLDKNLIHIEIDKSEIIQYKTEKLDDWQHKNILPKRRIYSIGVDFSDDYEDKLREQIEAIKGNRKSFILIEGVLFFLDRAETNRLFDFFDTLQHSGDFIGSGSFQDSLKDSQAFKRLLDFFGKKVINMRESDYQTINDIYYENIKNYKLIDHQDYFSLSKTYNNPIQLEKDLILNEHFYVLKKDT
ncbi:class I SAM-dependent methyltransferase [uncultured Psychroserpens sp.]|uniref:class I SAM-dependent methyltransferase n=1 Tax=uncultured Psychroserpens sp. TaxID=255436 RepID=UPI00260788E7|nr:class I SAM-dependent methyltransferase [uncultured Psychroserpens sp.]